MMPSSRWRSLVAVARAHAVPGQRLEKALLRVAGGDVEGGEDIAKVGQREGAALGDGAGGAHGGGEIGEQRLNLLRRFQPALAVAAEEAPDLVDGAAVVRAGQHVVHGALGGRCIAHVVGGDDADPVRARLLHGGAPGVCLGGVEVALGLEIKPVAPERR